MAHPIIDPDMDAAFDQLEKSAAALPPPPPPPSEIEQIDLGWEEPEAPAYRVAVLDCATDGISTRTPTYYWRDSGCGELSLDRAREVCAAGKRNGLRCQVVPADFEMFREAL